MKQLHDLRHRDEFPEWLNANGLTGLGVEVGVFEGDYSDLLLSRWHGGKLYGIDPFTHYPDAIYRDGANREDLPEMGAKTAVRFAGNSRYELIVAESLAAVTRFSESSLDFVYLDGNHGPDYIRQDIRVWWPKIKSGGVLCGHDMYERDVPAHLCGVATAVLDFLYENQLPAHVTACTSWWIIKP